MILSELQNYLMQQHRVSLAQMAVKFGIEADALRGMLSRLIYKGRVQKCSDPNRCHGCLICSEESLEFYEWIFPNQETISPVEQPTCGGVSCHPKSTSLDM